MYILMYILCPSYVTSMEEPERDIDHTLYMQYLLEFIMLSMCMSVDGACHVIVSLTLVLKCALYK